MNFEKIKDGATKEYKVTLSAAEIEEEVSKLIKRRASTFKAQGFRAGHVPENIVRQKYSDSLVDDAIKNLVNYYCNKIIKNEKISVATTPHYSIQNAYEPGKDVVCQFIIDAMPEFELKDFKCQLDKIEIEITDEDIKREQENLMNSLPFYDKAEDGYAIQSGDRVVFDTRTKINGVDNKKRRLQDQVCIADDRDIKENLIKDFIGKKVGDNFVINAGDGVEIFCNVKKIEKRVKNITWEDFLKRSELKVESNDFLTNAIKEKAQNMVYLYYKQQLMEFFSKEYSFAIPETILQQEQRNILATIRRNARPGDEEYNKTDAELLEECDDFITKRVIFGYVLNKIAQSNKIDATRDEMTNAIQFEMMQNPRYTKEIAHRYANSKEAWAYKRAELIEQKAINYLIEKCETKSTQKLGLHAIEDLLEKDDKNL